MVKSLGSFARWAKRALIGLIVGFTLANGAEATIINGTFTGSVYFTNGTAGGIALSTLMGQSVTGLFSYDSSLLTAGSSSPTLNQFNGSITTAITVGGFSVSETLNGNVNLIDLSGFQEFSFFGHGLSGDVQDLEVHVGTGAFSDFHNPGSVSFVDNSPLFGSAGETDFPGGGQLAYNLTSASVSAAVGEPDVVALFVLGFLAFGIRKLTPLGR